MTANSYSGIASIVEKNEHTDKKAGGYSQFPIFGTPYSNVPLDDIIEDKVEKPIQSTP